MSAERGKKMDLVNYDFSKLASIDWGQMVFFLGLHAPAPEGTPNDWYHHGEENMKAWAEYLSKSAERGHFAVPVESAERGCLIIPVSRKEMK